MRRRDILIGVIGGILATLALHLLPGCGSSPVNVNLNDVGIIGQSPTPTPTPVPSPSPTPAPCLPSGASCQSNFDCCGLACIAGACR